MNRTVDAMVIAVNDDRCLQTGWPLDRFDALILAGSNLSANRPAEPQSQKRWLGELLAGLLPACDGVVVICQDGGWTLPPLGGRTAAQWHRLAGGAVDVVKQTLTLMRT